MWDRGPTTTLVRSPAVVKPMRMPLPDEAAASALLVTPNAIF